VKARIMERERRLRDWFFLFYGIAMGALLGIFGNIFVAYYFEIYKNEWWLPYVAWASLGIILDIVIYMMIMLIRLGREELGEI